MLSGGQAVEPSEAAATTSPNTAGGNLIIIVQTYQKHKPKCGSCTKLDLSWNICDHQKVQTLVDPNDWDKSLDISL